MLVVLDSLLIVPHFTLESVPIGTVSFMVTYLKIISGQKISAVILFNKDDIPILKYLI